MQTGYFLFRSFRTGLVLTAIVVLWALSSVFFGGSIRLAELRSHFLVDVYPYLMGAFTLYAFAALIIACKKPSERLFIALVLTAQFLSVIAILLPASFSLLSRYAQGLLALAATVVALKITIDLARPLYREARLQRIAGERNKIAGSN